MWIKLYGYLLIAISLKSIEAKTYPIFSKTDHARQEVLPGRFKRQFGFPQNFEGFQNPGNNNGFSGNDIFFDNENLFNDFVQPNRNRGRANWVQSTPRPSRFTTVAIPGMGTTQSSCEDRCITTPQYDPVCGDNNVTYMNMARYRCALKCGKNVRIAAIRACPRV